MFPSKTSLKMENATEDSAIWTMMRSFYADIGGVALRVIRHPGSNEEPSEDFSSVEGDLPYLSPAVVEGSKQDLGRNRR